MQQLEAEHEFARHYRGSFPKGAPIKTADVRYLSGAEYCKQFGFSDDTVRRWAAIGEQGHQLFDNVEQFAKDLP